MIYQVSQYFEAPNDVHIRDGGFDELIFRSIFIEKIFYLCLFQISRQTGRSGDFHISQIRRFCLQRLLHILTDVCECRLSDDLS